MKCSSHHSEEATAVCIHCGRALCPSCVQKSESGRVVCSTGCAAALLATEQAIQSIRARSISSLRTTGYFALGAAVVFGCFGCLELYSGISRVGYFLLPLTLVFGVGGVFYLRIAKKKEQVAKAA